MATSAHLWAVSYDDVTGAARVRDAIIDLGWNKHYLILQDVAVVVRNPDGSFTLDRERFPAASNIAGLTLVGLLVGLRVGEARIGATVGGRVGGAGTAVAARVGIAEDCVRSVEALMKPGTSALFVLDNEGNMDVILHGIRGLGR